jgi:putative membrane protein
MSREIAAKAAPAPDQLKLALKRTFLAHERTLMAWVRTATSLITFGFALYKFFFYLREQQPDAAKHAEPLLGARSFGLIMIVVGVFTLAIATWQHRQQMKQLRALYADAPFSLSLVVAALIAGLGILALIAAVYQE